jgi:hypothetical protein
MKRHRLFSRLLSLSGLLSLSLIGVPGWPAFAGTLVVTDGIKMSMNAVPINGIGGSAAHARLVDGNGRLILDPAAGGGPFDFSTDLKVPAAIPPTVPAVSKPNSTEVGDALKAIFPVGLNALNAAKTINYNRAISQNKVNTPIPSVSADAVDLGRMFAAASATQKIAGGKVQGTAKAEVTRVGPGKSGPGFAVGAFHDPMTFGLVSPGSPATLDLFIGQDLTLTANQPGDLVTAFFDIGTDQVGTLADFSIGITFGTSNIDQVAINVDPGTFNPRSDFFTSTDSFSTFLRDSLVFNDATKTLTVKPDSSGNLSDINLYTVDMPVNGSPVTVTVIGGAIAGNAVPEPFSFTLCGIGSLGLWLYGWRRAR